MVNVLKSWIIIKKGFKNWYNMMSKEKTSKGVLRFIICLILGLSVTLNIKNITNYESFWVSYFLLLGLSLTMWYRSYELVGVKNGR